MTHELDPLLRAALADRALSGSERDKLAAFARVNVASPADAALARSRVFDVAREAATTDEARQLLTWAENAVKSLAPPANTATGEPSAVVFSPSTDCLALITHRFATCRRAADVCVFTITDDRIARAMLDAHRRGVKLRVISDDEKSLDPGSDIEKLEAAGVPVVIDRTPCHMHHKYALFDGERLLNGSYNWTRSAADQNEENVVDTGDPRLLAAFGWHFEQLWKRLGGR